MAVRVGVNGFGRIGMLFTKAAMDRGDIEVVAANDLMPFDSLANLFKHDSTHGIWPEDVSFDGNVLHVGDHEIKTFAERDPAQIPGATSATSWSSRRASSRAATGPRPTSKGGEEGHHLGPWQGCRRHLRLQGQPRGLRPRGPRDRLQRVMHDQLHYPDGKGDPGQLRHRIGLHDHRARLPTTRASSTRPTRTRGAPARHPTTSFPRRQARPGLRV